MAEAKETETCQNCRFWQPNWKFKKQSSLESKAASLDVAIPRNTSSLRSSTAKGLCRRYAPQTSSLTTVWMETKSEDWCGDYDLSK